jgi:hypothetical protein
MGAAFAVLLTLAGYLAVSVITGGAGAPRCTVRLPGDDGHPYEMAPEQAVNAATIEAVGSSRRVPERAVTIALATAMQESGLRNIRHGDRDSLGLFQQRPSQGWGNAEQIMDPVYSAGRFYEHLEKVRGYSRLPLTVAAQRVQHSGFPQAYAKHEPEAALLASALTGRTGGAFSCTTGPSNDKPGNPARVRARLIREFGPGVLPRAVAREPGASAALGKADGSGRRSASDSMVAVPVSRAADRNDAGRRGWEVAHWAVAHSSELHIAQVSYAGLVWSATDRSEQGWRKSPGGSRGKKAGNAGTVLITTMR